MLHQGNTSSGGAPRGPLSSWISSLPLGPSPGHWSGAAEEWATPSSLIKQYSSASFTFFSSSPTVMCSQEVSRSRLWCSAESGSQSNSFLQAANYVPEKPYLAIALALKSLTPLYNGQETAPGRCPPFHGHGESNTLRRSRFEPTRHNKLSALRGVFTLMIWRVYPFRDHTSPDHGSWIGLISQLRDHDRRNAMPSSLEGQL